MHGTVLVFLSLAAVLASSTIEVDSAVSKYPAWRVCEQRKKVGPCKAAKPRWYYNSLINQCKPFTWGGCHPNQNNFKTVKQCAKRCMRRSVCDIPKKIGPCRARIPKWFYNVRTKRCERFYWGGCQANGNNFASYSKCTKKCESVCLLPKKIGPCRASKKRYYYDAAKKACKVFYWGGCKPNKNNFKTLKACQKICSGK